MDYNIPQNLLLLAAGYAELHYHLPWLYPAYYRKQPEIIADLPHRLNLDNIDKLPIAIIIKDADKFPVQLQSVNVIMQISDIRSQQQIIIDEQINSKFLERVYWFDIRHLPVDSQIQVTVEINVKIADRQLKIINDNLPGISQKPFSLWLGAQAIAHPDGWYAGDPHYHSIYTADQVEFGAGIITTKIMAEAMGLSWFCVTDHSYDLDDKVNDYTANDPELPKWKAMRHECKQLDSAEFRIISGEEVSIGNSKRQNVHLLALEHSEFIEGHGDSAEVWGKNKPQHFIKEIPLWKNEDNLFIAAHPLDKVSFAQKLTLNRGNWDLQDYQEGKISHLQMINSDDQEAIKSNINSWKEYLLLGYRLFIMAGNDAHGNFNVMRQIKLPFLTLWENRKQIFGRWVTIFESEKNDPISAIKKGRMIISNGAFLAFYLTNSGSRWDMGQTCPQHQAKLHYTSQTTTQTGEVSSIYCYIGNCFTGVECRIQIDSAADIELPAKGYIRMSLITINGYQVFTNPIFTDHS